MLKYSILSQLRQKENFPVLECENGFWELRLGILGVISSWLPLLTFTKFVELRFTVLISLNVLLDIKFCFKCRKETLWFHLEHLRYEILTPDSAFLNTFFKFFEVEIWSVYFYPEEAIIEFSNSLYWQNIIIEFFLHLEWINSFHFSISPWVYTTDKNQLCAVNRCSIAARTPVKYLFHNELKKQQFKKMKQWKPKY